MGFKLVALSSWLLTVRYITTLESIFALSIEHNAIGGGCIDLLCPDTASHHGLRNLVNEDTLKTDACSACSQCTENGYSVCLRPKDSRASRTAGGCSCAHTLAANCHTDLTQTQHPANLTMKTYTACYADALQRPPQPLAVNENSSVVVTIEPFWLEPYWRHLKIENVTLHYKFQVKAPEHCEGEVESTPAGIHTCVASVLVDLSESKEDQPGAKDDDDYDHSDNYDQYDDDLPPEVQFDRDVFSGAKELESYYTATIRRSRQIKASASKNEQIYDGETIMESEHLKFDLKPELYVNGESDVVDEPSDDSVVVTTTEEESATVVQEDKDEGDVSDETGGTNFFEEEEKKEEETKKEKESEEEDGVLKVNLEDIEPTKLKSQEEAKKKAEEEGDEEEKEEKEDDVETTTEKDEEKSGEDEKKDEEEEKKEEDEDKNDEEKKDDDDEEGTTAAGEDSAESSEDSEETTTVELIEGETDPSQQNFWQRFVNGENFFRVRNIFVACLTGFIIICAVALCCVYSKRCCKTKESKTSNGYRYTSANPPPTELKTVSRVPSGAAPEDEQRLLAEGEALEAFRNVVKSGTPIQPNKVELGITVGMGKFGPIHRAMFNSYNGSVHDVNVYLLKNVSRLSDDELVKLTSLLKSNISAGAHPNVVSLCGISPAGSDVMLMWEPLHQSVLRGVLRESRCARFGTEPFNMASFLSSERLAAIAIGCCNGVEHLLKKNVFPTHLSTSNVLLAERGIVKIGGFGLAEHHALDMTTESVSSIRHILHDQILFQAPTKLRWMSPEYFKRDHKMIHNEQTMIWPLGVTLWEIFSLGGTPFASLRQTQTFIDAMRDGSAQLDPISYCGEAVTQLLSTCTSHIPEARGDIRTIIKRLECISADAKTQINLSYREDFPYLPIVTPLEQQKEE
ncbi:hypothetical protein CRE_10086 [Caenorhabditis remanei]|uniref:Protein kinase domain-containing protein n=1 Tax=Caenorhabditis remanei TaxID=31234 RepID=E3M638_CAERE|nr:hypothetical protein CRE_10086 [Caenorhabditis remanei]